jgi:periplasmic divalent cation tolerance protein
MAEMESLVLVMVTAPDLETARSIARALVDRKIAACVNISPGLISVYAWKGELEESQEVLLLIKTRAALVQDHLIPLVHDLHPYELPEIISLPIVGGSRMYLDWIQEETQGGLL